MPQQGPGPIAQRLRANPELLDTLTPEELARLRTALEQESSAGPLGMATDPNRVGEERGVLDHAYEGLSRFLRFQVQDPVQMGLSAVGAIPGAIADPAGAWQSVKDTGKAMVSGMGEMMAEDWEKGVQAQQAGSPVEAAGYKLASRLPGVGRMAAEQAEDIGAGNYGAGIGGGLGLLSPLSPLRILGAVPAVKTARMGYGGARPPTSQRLTFGDVDIDLPVLRSESQGVLLREPSRFMQSIGRKAIPGRGAYKKLDTERTVQIAKDAADAAVAAVSEIGMPPGAVGDAAINAFEAGREGWRSAASRLYDSARARVADRVGSRAIAGTDRRTQLPIQGPSGRVRVQTPEGIRATTSADSIRRQLAELEIPTSEGAPSAVAQSRIEMGLRGDLPSGRDAGSAVTAANRRLDATDTARRSLAEQEYTAIRAGEQTAPGFVLQTAEGAADIVDVRGVKAQGLDELNKILNRRLIARESVTSKSREMIENLLNSPDFVGFVEAQQYRSDLLDIIRTLDATPKTKRVATMLRAETDKAIVAAADATGDPTIMRMVEVANKTWREAAEAYDRKFIKSFINANPSKAHRLLLDMPTADYDLIRKYAGPVHFERMKAQVLLDEFQVATKGERALSQASDAAAVTTEVAEGIKFNGEVFLGWLEKHHATGRLQEMYSPEQIDNLYELARSTIRAKQAAVEPFGGFVATRASVTVMVSPFAAAAGEALGLLPSGSTALASGVALATGSGLATAAYLSTHPQGVAWFRNFVRAVGANDVRQAVFWGGRIEDLMNKSEVQAELRKLQDPGVMPVMMPPERGVTYPVQLPPGMQQ